jgi:hypothetical protein
MKTKRTQGSNSTNAMCHPVELSHSHDLPGKARSSDLREGVNAWVVLRRHLLACAQAACAHDFAAACTEGTALLADRV